MWEIVELVEVVDINKESADPTRDFPERKFSYIDIDCVENGSGIIGDAKKIMGREAPSRARRVIHRGDVLMSTVRPYLKAFAIVPGRFDNQICSTGFAVLTPKERLDPLYLLQSIFSKTVIDQCNRFMMGGQYPALSSSQVGKIRILLPPLAEQKKIAEILGTADDAIERVTDAIAKTQRLKKGLMQELLTRGIGHTKFKETEIGRMPKEWKRTRIGEIAAVRYGLGQPTALDVEGVPMIRATNIKRGKIVRTGLIHVRRSEIPTSRDPFLKEGEIIVVRSGAYTGDVAVVTKDWAGAVAGYDLVITPSSEVTSEFLGHYLLSGAVQKYFGGQSVRSAQPHLNSEQIEKTPAMLPPLPEQREISKILGTVDDTLELLKNKRERFQKVKKGLMDDLLTGRRRVKF